MPRKPSRTLTDAEARVMAVLWESHSASVADVVRALSKRRAVSYSTVQTILRILAVPRLPSRADDAAVVQQDRAGPAVDLHLDTTGLAA